MASEPGQTLPSTTIASQLSETLAETSTTFNPEIESTKISTSTPWARLTTKSIFFKEIDISEEKCIIGREKIETSSTSEITDPLLISRQHFSITKEHSSNDFKILLEDLSSAGSTWKNCSKIAKGKKVEIKENDLIGINCKATKASYSYKLELIKKPRRGSKRKQKLPENSQDFDFTSISVENNKTMRMESEVFASPRTRTTRSKRKLDDNDSSTRTTRSKSNDVSRSKGTSKAKTSRSNSCSSNSKRSRKN